jgi:hypothetical protein
MDGGTSYLVMGLVCCDITVTQINYSNLNKQDSKEQVNGRYQEEDLVQVFMLDDLKLGGFEVI